MNRKLLSITLIAAIALCLIFGGMIIRGNSGSETPALAQNVEIADTEATPEVEPAEEQEAFSLDGSVGLPDFVTGTVCFGSYEKPVRLPNENNYSSITLSGTGKLDIPESSVISAVQHRWGDEYRLCEQKTELFKRLFGVLADTDVSETEGRLPGNRYVDVEIRFLLLTARGEYACVGFYSFEDDYVEIAVGRESDPNNTVCYCATSAELHAILRECIGLKSGSAELITGAESIAYTTKDGGTAYVSAENAERLAALLADAKTVHNYYSGCSFGDVTVTTGGQQYKAFFANDGCPIFIIEDKTFHLQSEQEHVLVSIFPEAEWHGLK